MFFFNFREISGTAFWRNLFEHFEGSGVPAIFTIANGDGNAVFCTEIDRDQYREIYEELNGTKEEIYAESLLLLAWSILLRFYSTAGDVCFLVRHNNEQGEMIEFPVATKTVFDERVAACLWEIHQFYPLALERAGEAGSVADILKSVGLEAELFATRICIIGGGAPTGEVYFPLENKNIKLQIALRRTASGLKLDMLFSRSFPEEIIKNLSRHFLNILTQLIRYPEKTMQQITPFAADDIELMLPDRSVITRPLPSKTLVDYFIEHLGISPQTVAITFADRSLTREELYQQALFLARYLSFLGAGINDRVVLCLERCLEMSVGILAILLSGAALSPMEPNEPEELLRHKINESGTRIILTQERFGEQLQRIIGESVVVIALDNLPANIGNSEIQTRDLTNDDAEKLLDSVLYLLFTSGSTGWPKGCLNSQRAVLNFLVTVWRDFNISPTDVILHKTALSFDMHFGEVLSFLLGARLAIAAPDAHKDPALLVAEINRHQVTVVHFVPSLFEIFLDYLIANPTAVKKCDTLRLIFLIGEAVSINLQEKCYKIFAANRLSLVSLYGPTETAIAVLTKLCFSHAGSGSEKIRANPLGIPIDNTYPLVLHPSLHSLTPIGVLGELWWGGMSVSNGYLNPQQTAEKYLSFAQLCLPENISMLLPCSTFYKSGDIVALDRSGEFWFIGRYDTETKIHGVRIDLAMIEEIISDVCPTVKCVAIIRDIAQDKMLVVFIVSGSLSQKTENELTRIKHSLQVRLPPYIAPVVVEVDKLPLNRSGKVDKVALKKYPLKIMHTGQVVILPKNDLEQFILDLLCKIKNLPRDFVSTTDNLFSLGIDSFAAYPLIAEINSKYKLSLCYGDFLSNPSICQLAEYVNARIVQKVRGDSLILLADIYNQRKLAGKVERARFVLSQDQSRLYFLSQLLKNGSAAAFNIVDWWRIDGGINLERLKKSFLLLIKEQAILRTIYGVDGAGAFFQEVLDYDDVIPRFTINVINLWGSGSEVVREKVKELLRIPFNIMNELPLRAYVVNVAENVQYLILIVHHIASDGVSIGIVRNKLSQYYSEPCEQLVLKYQYCDFAEAYAKWLSQQSMTQRIAYWLNRLDNVPVTMIPYDKPERPAVDRRYLGDAEYINFSSAIVREVEDIAKLSQVTPYIVWLSMFYLLLGRFINASDLVVGMPISRRDQHLALNDIIGFFVGIVILRVEFSASDNFIDVVKKVDKAMQEALLNSVPYEKIITALNPIQRGQTPLVNVVFVFEEEETPATLLRLGEGLQVTPLNPVTVLSRQDIEVHCQKGINGELKCWIEYSTELYEAVTIKKFAAYFQLIADILSDQENRSRAIATLDIMSNDDRKHIALFSSQLENDFPVMTLKELFEQSVKKYAHSIAVHIVGEKAKSLTYSQVNERANKLARFLLTKITPPAAILLFMERGVDLIIAILAAVKAGIAYVPIDLRFPSIRIEQARLKCGVNTFILTSSESAAILMDTNDEHKLVINLGESQIAGQQATDLPTVADARSCSHMICTSGSTGEAKIVQLSHLGLVNLAYCVCRELHIDATSRVLQFSSPGFDARDWEMWPTFLAGGSLCLAEEKQLLPGEAIWKTLGVGKITHATLPPPLLRTTNPVAKLAAFKVLIAAGSECTPDIPRKWLSSGIDLFVNAYGPTEYSVCSAMRCYSAAEIARLNDEVMIGRPIANTKIIVVDDYGRLAVPGGLGELCVNGVGLMLGYLRDEQATRQAFLRIDGNDYYRTGDIARLMLVNDKYELVYVNRKQGYVKIAGGYRVDLLDVQQNICKIAGVADAFITTVYDSTDIRRLMAYVSMDSAFVVNDTVRGSSDVAGWQQTFDMLYREARVGQEFDIIGWLDGMRKPISAADMQLWASETYQRILQYLPRLSGQPLRIWDNGCGTGMIMNKFLTHDGLVVNYTGTDISVEVIGKLTAEIRGKKLRDGMVVEFYQQEAVIPLTGHQKFNVVLLNSVVQYFPSVDYLRRVIFAAVDKVAAEGIVCLYDVRNMLLNDVYHREIGLLTTAPTTSMRTFLANCAYRSLLDKELTIDPIFFEKIASEHRRITGVRIEIKKMGRFAKLDYRYDVTFFVEREVKQIAMTDVCVWSREMDLAQLVTEGVGSGKAKQLVVVNIPNAVVSRSKVLMAESPRFNVVGELQEAYDQSNGSVVDPKLCYALAEKCGCDVLVTFSRNDPYSFDCVFTAKELNPMPVCVALPHRQYAQDEVYANDPNIREMYQKYQRYLQEKLGRLLPTYMLPQHVVIVPSIPLNSRGKVDVNALPLIDFSMELSSTFVPPSNELQHQLTAIFAKVLGKDKAKISIDHDFFKSLGGDSLSLLKVIAEVNKITGCDFAVQEFYTHATVRALEKIVIEKRSLAATNPRANSSGQAVPASPRSLPSFMC